MTTSLNQYYLDSGELSPADLEARHERTDETLADVYREAEKVIEAVDAMFEELKVSRGDRGDFLGGLLDGISDMLFGLTEGDSKEADHTQHEGPAFKRAREFYEEWDAEKRHMAMLREGGA